GLSWRPASRPAVASVGRSSMRSRMLSGSGAGSSSDSTRPEALSAALGVGRDLREHAKRRLPDRQLEEFGVHAAEIVGPPPVAALHLDPAHRQGPAYRLDGAEAGRCRLGRAEQVDVDLDLVDLPHAPDVG